jgi:fumarylacetoacetase
MSLTQSWITIPEHSDFTLANIPFGICVVDNYYYACSRIGDQVILLSHLIEEEGFAKFEIPAGILNEPFLNSFIALGKSITVPFREAIQSWLSDESNAALSESNIFYHIDDVVMMLPVHTRDYTDFYSSIEHATNVGKMFRDPANALLPNWRHLPVGYHGRASSIVVSGVDLHRPMGQTMAKDATAPSYSASKRVDFELEMACIIGKENMLGSPVTTAEAEASIFGLALFNDWSARDIQKWEYVPLGPFLGKSFGSSLSPWIVTIEALNPFRVNGPTQEPEVLPYLQYTGAKNFDINLSVSIQPDGADEAIVCRSNYQYMYWNLLQQIAHHTVNGCNLQIGDILASGTISGKDESSYGSMLELSWAGSKKVDVGNGQTRVFIDDNDTVIMRGHSGSGDQRVGFGEVSTKILPAHGK